jgi:hypothetical protein
MAPRGRDPKEQGHETGVRHHGLAFNLGETQNSRIQLCTRDVERDLRARNRRRSAVSVQDRTTASRRPGHLRFSPHTIAVNNAKPASAII